MISGCNHSQIVVIYLVKMCLIRDWKTSSIVVTMVAIKVDKSSENIGGYSLIKCKLYSQFYTQYIVFLFSNKSATIDCWY
jgi:hypothetical protein